MAEGVLKAMILTKVKFALVMFLGLGVLATGAGLAIHKAPVAKKQKVEPQQRPQIAALVEDQLPARIAIWNWLIPAGRMRS
jgi:hypothetical protein